jgi:putative NADH-flavin reductase
MKVAIFGASGATGRLLTERCLAAGHQVTALLRKPCAFPYLDRVTAIEGDAFTPAAVQDTVRGAEVVLSALGARSLGKEDVLERAVPLIVRAMQELGPRRIVVLGSAGALDTAMDKQPAWQKWLVEHVVYKTLLKWPVASQRAQYAALSASTLDWTMAMPPMLTNGAGRGRYRVDEAALPPGAVRIARADVADFMMQQLESEAWSRKAVYLSW